MINIDTVKEVFKKNYSIDLEGPFGSYYRTNGTKFKDLDFIAPRLPNNRRFMQFDYNYDSKKINIDVWSYKDNYEKLFLEFTLKTSKQYNIVYRKLAQLKGFKLSQYGLFKKNGEKVNVTNDKQILKLIGKE